MPGSSTTPSQWFSLAAQAGNSNNKVCYIDPPNAFWVDTVLNSGATVLQEKNKFATQKRSHRRRRYDADDDDDSVEGDPSYHDFTHYKPLESACISTERLQRIHRVPLGPFPEKWLRAMNMSESEIESARAKHDERNDPKVYNLISTEELKEKKNVYSDLGILLESNDYGCFNNDKESELVFFSIEN